MLFFHKSIKVFCSSFRIRKTNIHIRSTERCEFSEVSVRTSLRQELLMAYRNQIMEQGGTSCFCLMCLFHKFCHILPLIPYAVQKEDYIPSLQFYPQFISAFHLLFILICKAGKQPSFSILSRYYLKVMAKFLHLPVGVIDYPLNACMQISLGYKTKVNKDIFFALFSGENSSRRYRSYHFFLAMRLIEILQTSQQRQVEILLPVFKTIGLSLPFDATAFQSHAK